MSVLAPLLELDPLIAEAKQRARRRRLLFATAGMAATAVVATTLAVRRSERLQPLALAPPACRAGQLRLALTHPGVAAGSVVDEFSFRNASSAVCRLSGWPSFRLVMRDRREVAPRAHELIAFAYSVEHPPPLPRVRLTAGMTVQWWVQAADGAGFNRMCPTSRAMLVRPPGAQGAITVAARLPYCGPRRFDVLPVGRAP